MDQLKMIKNLFGLDDDGIGELKIKQRLCDLLLEMENNTKRFESASLGYAQGYLSSSKIGYIVLI